MKNKVFDIDKFNVISDDNFYYVFRALNNGDHHDIEQGITADSETVQRIRTDRERWEEINGKSARFSSNDNISLEEVWLHIKKNYSKETNCISLSSNANVSIDYGQGYNEEYVMIKVPKIRDGKTVLAGQYMLEELSKNIEETIKHLPDDSEVLTVIRDIENGDSPKSLRNIADKLFKKVKSNGKYIGTNIDIDRMVSIRDRFSKKQYFSEEQQIEYNKIIAKLTALELYGKTRNILPKTSSNSSLISTIGMAFSSGELIHYKDIEKNEIIPISKEMMDVFSLVQQAKNFKNLNNDKTKKFEKKIIDYIANGGSLEIEKEAVESQIEELTIDRLYEITKGKIGYEKAKATIEFLSRLNTSRIQTLRYVDEINRLFNVDGEFDDIIKIITDEGFIIDSNIITRENGKGVQIAESVNIKINNINQKLITDTEQKQIVDRIISEGNKNFNNVSKIYNYLESLLDQEEEKTENTYFAEAIVDTLDMVKIYKNSIRDKNLNEAERKKLVAELEKADCKRLFNAFTKAGISESEVSGYIINILASNGYQGHTFEELSRLDDLDDIISKNVNNTNLKGHVYPSVMEEIRGIVDNDNRVGETLINLRDYQQETVENVDRIFEAGKRFAGVVLPTGAGKSFVAMTEMLKNQNGNILYIAPQQEILSQVQRHILKNIAKVEVLTTDEIDKLKEEQNAKNVKELKLPKGKILSSQVNEYVKKVFPHLKMLCYQGLSSQNVTELTDEQILKRDKEEKELREILKNADTNLIVFDELHRSGAKTWKGVVEQLIKSNEKANILGITATPIRDVDHIDMMKELANMTHTYTEDEMATKQYLGYEMYLADAIQRELVVEPKIVSFDFMLRDNDEYQEIQEMIENEKNESKKKQLIEIKAQIDDLINGDTDITEHVKNNISQKENEEIGKIIKSTIQKKDGRYIVFLPQHTHDDGLNETQYFEQQEQKIREILLDIDTEPEISRLSSADSKTENHRAITDFENSSSKHLKIMLAINKLNEGVHVDGINGEIMYRKINDGSTILYLQQLGRVIYSLDPDEQILDEDIPIVYDIYNNYLIQNMNRTVNQTTPKSDLQKLQEVIEWMDKHGYDPDINSENTKEARKAITLKKIQKKYKKYIDGIDNPRLSKSDIYEIEQILELAYSIDLFNKEIGERIIPPGEKDLSEVQLFKITATQKKFLELYKDANKVLGNKERHKNRPNAKLNDIMNILEVLNSNDIFIDNNLIQYGDTLKAVIERCPEEIRQILLEELSNFDEEYPVGQEYNFAKASFRDNSNWKYFKDADVRKLYACGIFEDVDENYISECIKDKYKIEKIKGAVLFNDFIIYGYKSLRNLNVKTGTYFDENGNSCPLLDTRDQATKRFEYRLSVIRQVQKHLQEGYSLANESLDEIASLSARDCIRLYRPSNHNEHGNYYAGIPKDFNLREEMYYASAHLRKKDIELSEQEIIEYKKLGILPLNINKDGIDVETRLPRDFFGKSVKTIEIQKINDEDLKHFNNLKEILTTSRYSYKVCTTNESMEDLPKGNFFEYISAYRADGTNGKRKGIPRQYDLKKEIERAREYLGKTNKKLSTDEIIEYKKLGILPLNLDESGIDIDTNLPRDEFEFICVDFYGFDKKGYYCKKQEDGTYINTGLKYNTFGFKKDRKHIITGRIEDIRHFDINGKCWDTNRKYDKGGFLQDGTHKDTGELYHNGYNAFGLDENGKNRQGRVPKEITFTKEYIINGVLKGKAKEILTKYGIKNRGTLNFALYSATEMCPQIKVLLCEQISKYQRMIIQREEKLKQLEIQKSEDKEQIEKLKKENTILRNRISLMNPMQDLDK